MNLSLFAATGTPGGVGASTAIVNPQLHTPLAQVCASSATLQPLYSSQRLTFSDDGTGVPYNSSLSIEGPSVVNQDVSHYTKSRDPVMVRSRVFIGRLTNVAITRDDLIALFRPFGNVLALNYFKQGYAFVQFSTPNEADAAVASLNGKKWMGVIIEVETAKNKEQRDSNMRKRDGEDDCQETRASKLSRTDLAPLEEIRLQNRFNRTVALGDCTTTEMISAEMADTMICGACRYVTSDYEAFKDHRIAGCSKRKDEEEPKCLKCVSCDGRYKSAWALLYHLTEFHRMVLFKVEEEQEIQSVTNETARKLEAADYALISPEVIPKMDSERRYETRGF